MATEEYDLLDMIEDTLRETNFEIGDAVECYFPGRPGIAPQPGIVVNVEGSQVYAVGDKFGRWFDLDMADATIRVRKTRPAEAK